MLKTAGAKLTAFCHSVGRRWVFELELKTSATKKCTASELYKGSVFFCFLIFVDGRRQQDFCIWRNWRSKNVKFSYFFLIKKYVFFSVPDTLIWKVFKERRRSGLYFMRFFVMGFLNYQETASDSSAANRIVNESSPSPRALK